MIRDLVISIGMIGFIVLSCCVLVGQGYCARNPGAQYIIGSKMELARCPK
jgi:hypothetical protein